MAIEFDAGRFREAVLYIAWRTRQDAGFGRIKLAKTLFYADFAARRGGRERAQLAFLLCGRPQDGSRRSSRVGLG